MINVQPGDRVSHKHRPTQGVVQWIDWDRGEMSVATGLNAYVVDPIDQWEFQVNRVLKDVNQMSEAEMRLEIELLRESRKIAISESRKRSQKARTESKKVEAADVDEWGIPVAMQKILSPEQLAIARAKAQAKKEAEA